MKKYEDIIDEVLNIMFLPLLFLLIFFTFTLFFPSFNVKAETYNSSIHYVGTGYDYNVVTAHTQLETIRQANILFHGAYWNYPTEQHITDNTFYFKFTNNISFLNGTNASFYTYVKGQKSKSAYAKVGNTVCPATQYTNSVYHVQCTNIDMTNADNVGIYYYVDGIDYYSTGIYFDISNIEYTQSQESINKETNEKLDNINDSLTDSSIDSPDSSFNDYNDKLATNGVITNLITLPIQLFTNILNSINGTCSTFSLGNLMGTDLNLPCINVSNYLGSDLWNVIDILFSGLFILVIARKMIKVFENFSSMREGDVLGD